MTLVRTSQPWALAALLAGCGGDDGRGDTAGPTTAVTMTTLTTMTGATTGAPTGGGTGDDTTGAPTGTTGPVEPTGTATGTGAPTTTGDVTDATTGPDGTSSSTATASDGTTTGGTDTCARVDFLFVIDNSVSMEGEQAALTAAFPAFIDTIKTTVPATDYNIMVVDSDDTGRCSPTMCTHSTCQAANKYACMNIFSDCDITRGAGVVNPAGEYASNMQCPFEAGKRYLTSSDPNLASTFECAAKVGTAGNPSERPLDGMVEAVSPALLGPGGCNEGFLRDDAILVVTFISDDGNLEDVNTAQQTYDALVAAKGGDADRIVMLGLIPGNGCGGEQPHWTALIDLFGERGIRGGVCEVEYDTFFQAAVGTILDTCVINPG